MSNNAGVLLLAGPTASGKTELALALAQRFDAEIVGADSRQIYRGMPIGTAVANDEQRARVTHHCVAFLEPSQRYSAARFARDAMAAIAGIQARGKRAIVAGGTGFYLRALLGGVSLAPQYDSALRRRLAAEAALHPPEFLHAWLATRDARRASQLHPRDSYRVLRALEVALAPAREPLEVALAPAREPNERRAATLSQAGIPSLLVALDVPLPELDARIAARTDAMLSAGLIEEAERIGAGAVAADAVGYPQALAYVRGWCTAAELRETLARATRRYARRQRAWLRGEPGAVWLPPNAVESAVREKLGWSANDG